MLAGDLLTGTTLWESDKVQGHAVEVAVNYEKGLALILTVNNNHATKDKLDIYAVDYGNGQVLWHTEYSDKIDLYGKEKGSRFFPTFDLSGANPPIFDGNAVYMTYAGIHKYSLKDGSLLWKNAYDVTEGKIKRGNAQASRRPLHRHQSAGTRQSALREGLLRARRDGEPDQGH